MPTLIRRYYCLLDKTTEEKSSVPTLMDNFPFPTSVRNIYSIKKVHGLDISYRLGLQNSENSL